MSRTSDWLPNDTAHVSLSGGGAASGSMKFELKSGTCSALGSTLYTQTVTQAEHGCDFDFLSGIKS